MKNLGTPITGYSWNELPSLQTDLNPQTETSHREDRGVFKVSPSYYK